MKSILKLFLFVTLFATTCTYAQTKKVTTSKVALVSKMDSISYSIGMNLVKSYLLDTLLGDIDLNLVSQGILDYKSEKGSLITEEKCNDILLKYQTEVQQKSFLAASETNRKAGEDFLSKNKSEPGVIALPSGLQFKVINAGKGKTPSINDTALVHYKGTFLNGQVFDDSRKRENPIEVPISAVIKGWQDALLMMKEGDVWVIYVPSQLAYADKGFSTIVGPNETLIFEIELVAIK